MSQLSHPPPAIDPYRIERETFVAIAEVHAELASTNDRALRLAESAAPLPHLIIAIRQTAGRGRGANRWWSDAGGLTFSLILPAPPVPAERLPLVSLTIGGAVCRVVQESAPGADVRLKWPNDVYLEGRKLCGILVEVPPRAAGRLIVGVGLNANNSLSAAPAEIRERATSLADATRREFDLTDLLIRLLRQIERDVAALAAADVSLARRWRELCLLTGRSVTIREGTRMVSGTCRGIEDDGALLVETMAGPQRYYGGVVEAFA